MTAPCHVAVVGGSGSGKTWLAEHLAATLAPQAARISLDDFYRDLSPLPLAQRDSVNFDDPAAIDWDTLRNVMDQMAVGGAVELPRYDFATHTRLAATRRFDPVPLVIWDGLWLLHHGWLAARFAASIYVDCPAELRFQRRAERDLRERGRTLESVRRQFYEQVEPMHNNFVNPQKASAQRVLASPPDKFALENLLLEIKSLPSQP
jgi:uridine kinase